MASSKIIVCDSSSLISLAESCSLGALKFLGERFKVEFVIPPSVEKEIVERPGLVGKFSFSAARLKNLINKGVLKVVSSTSLREDSKKIAARANSVFRAKKPLEILQAGEIECLALLKPFNAKAFLIDEKTTRLLVEDPKKLYSLMRGEYADVTADERELSEFKKQFKAPVIRSTELLAIAAQNGFFEYYEPDAQEVFHSAIYALRYAGCSISQREIDDYQKIRI